MTFAIIPAWLRYGMFLSAIFASGAPAASAATAMSVEVSGAGPSATVRLLWPQKVAAKATADGDAVVVTFDRDVDPSAARDIVAMLPGWIEGVEADGPRLRLVPKAGNRASAAVVPRGVEVRLSGAAQARQMAQAPSGGSAGAVGAADEDEVAQAPAASSTDDEAAAAKRRLRLTEARLMMETGDVQGARRVLQGLLDEVPNSVEVMAALASTESQAGSWRKAIGLYDRALGLNPDDPSLIRAKAELLREHGPRIRLDVDHRKVHEADRQIVARASGEALAGPSIVGFALEGNDLETPAVRSLDGTISRFDGKRFRGEGYVALDHDDASITRLSLIGGTGIVGASVRHTRALGDGTMRLALIGQDPYWEVVDGLVNEARTDRAQIAYEQLLGTSWRISGRLAGGRYGVKGDSDVAHFIGPAFEVAYTAISGPPSLTVAYGFDAEYLGSRQTKVDAFGSEYPLLSVVSREVHSGTLGFSGTVSTDLRYNLYGGYAYDRLNSDGPFFGGDIAYEPSASFELGLAASHSLTASRGTDSTVTRIGGYFLWRL